MIITLNSLYLTEDRHSLDGLYDLRCPSDEIIGFDDASYGLYIEGDKYLIDFTNLNYHISSIYQVSSLYSPYNQRIISFGNIKKKQKKIILEDELSGYSMELTLTTRKDSEYPEDPVLEIVRGFNFFEGCYFEMGYNKSEMLSYYASKLDSIQRGRNLVGVNNDSVDFTIGSYTLDVSNDFHINFKEEGEYIFYYQSEDMKRLSGNKQIFSKGFFRINDNKIVLRDKILDGKFTLIIAKQGLIPDKFVIPLIEGVFRRVE